jgi:LmbE family N-acetylglucosaminyl deacetylase
MMEEGAEVYVTVFSMVNPSIAPAETLREEFKCSIITLGISPYRTKTFYYPMRDLLMYRQPILETIVRQRDEVDPDVVFIPSLQDMHQDHQVVANEGFRAFKDRTTLGYELPWNNLNFQTTHFIEIKARHLEKKVEAISQYHSQIGKKYSEPGYIRALAITRGHQVNLDYAECFEVYRWIRTV